MLDPADHARLGLLGRNTLCCAFFLGAGDELISSSVPSWHCQQVKQGLTGPFVSKTTSKSVFENCKISVDSSQIPGLSTASLASHLATHHQNPWLSAVPWQ